MSRWRELLGALLLSACAWLLVGQTAPAAQTVAAYADPRLRTVVYSANEVYRLTGRVGYVIDLQFEGGERFIGVGLGDVQELALTAETNHLFIKPRASRVHTNLTVLTNRRVYHFDYATTREADADAVDLVFALRFVYPPLPGGATSQGASTVRDAQGEVSREQGVAAALRAQTSAPRRRNIDYWYCGRPEIQPLGAWDDGVETHLRFGPRVELPAVFVRNDDGSESLVDSHIDHDEVVLHRVARRFVLRRGKLVGCIVNKSFAGSGAPLPSGTLSPEIERTLRESLAAPLDQ